MAAEKTTAPAQHGQKGADQPAWYDFLINIFKKLLEYNMSNYGTKKKF